MSEDAYYFGRGSGDCIGVEVRPGNYARVFVGNKKTNETCRYLLLDREELYLLSMFFMALWCDRGQDFRTSRLIDDPHDSIFINGFDFEQVETV